MSRCCVCCVEMATKTGRASAGSRHQQQQQQQLARRTRRHQTDEQQEQDDKSQDSLDDSPPAAPTSPRALSRDDVLVALGYRPAAAGSVESSQSSAGRAHLLPRTTGAAAACRRCAKNVYPLELVDIGDRYHRGCFKCYVSARASLVAFHSRLPDISVSYSSPSVGGVAQW